MLFVVVHIKIATSQNLGMIVSDKRYQDIEDREKAISKGLIRTTSTTNHVFFDRPCPISTTPSKACTVSTVHALAQYR